MYELDTAVGSVWRALAHGELIQPTLALVPVGCIAAAASLTAAVARRCAEGGAHVLLADLSEHGDLARTPRDLRHTQADPARPRRRVRRARDPAHRGDALRTSGLEIYGAARNMSGMPAAYQQVVEWVRNGDLVVAVTTAPLSEVTEAWTRTDLRGRRIVITPGRSG